MNYYNHHIGDYRRDTAHLSLLEHGVYRQLLDQYYLNEKPIGLDEAKLMRSLCVRTPDEERAVKNVLADFFICTTDGYIHKRCDIEIEAFHGKSKSASESAKARWDRVRAEKDANAMRTHNEGNANQEPRTNNQEKPKTKSKTKPSLSLPDWLEKSDWEILDRHRKGKKWTEDAQKLCIEKLDEYRAQGFSPGAVIKNSVANGYQGLFPPKGNGHAKPAKFDPSLATVNAIKSRMGRASDAEIYEPVRSQIYESDHERRTEAGLVGDMGN